MPKKKTNRSNAKIVPRWSDLVSPFHDEARFWHSIWVSAGCPINTDLHTIMKRTRNQYHYALRRCKRASEEIMKDKLINSCINGRDNIFDKIQKMRRLRNKILSTIDGKKYPEKRFKDVYEELYNSTNDKEEISNT